MAVADEGHKGQLFKTYGGEIGRGAREKAADHVLWQRRTKGQGSGVVERGSDDVGLNRVCIC